MRTGNRRPLQAATLLTATLALTAGRAGAVAPAQLCESTKLRAASTYSAD